MPDAIFFKSLTTEDIPTLVRALESDAGLGEGEQLQAKRAQPWDFE